MINKDSRPRVLFHAQTERRQTVPDILSFLKWTSRKIPSYIVEEMGHPNSIF